MKKEGYLVVYEDVDGEKRDFYYRRLLVVKASVEKFKSKEFTWGALSRYYKSKSDSKIIKSAKPYQLYKVIVSKIIFCSNFTLTSNDSIISIYSNKNVSALEPEIIGRGFFGFSSNSDLFMKAETDEDAITEFKETQLEKYSYSEWYPIISYLSDLYSALDAPVYVGSDIFKSYNKENPLFNMINDNYYGFNSTLSDSIKPVDSTNNGMDIGLIYRVKHDFSFVGLGLAPGYMPINKINTCLNLLKTDDDINNFFKKAKEIFPDTHFVATASRAVTQYSNELHKNFYAIYRESNNNNNIPMILVPINSYFKNYEADSLIESTLSIDEMWKIIMDDKSFMISGKELLFFIKNVFIPITASIPIEMRNNNLQFISCYKNSKIKEIAVNNLAEEFKKWKG